MCLRIVDSNRLVSIPCVYLWLVAHGRLLAVRWDWLFDDLEAQFETSAHDEFADEVSDRSRREVAGITLLDRLRPACGTAIECAVDGAGVIRATLARVGPGWMLLAGVGHGEALIAADAVLSVRGLPRAAASPDAAGAVGSRLDLGHVLRAIARDRSPVEVITRDGSRHHGTVDRVGADFLDLAEHAPGEPRRAGEVSGVRTVSFAGLAVVRTS
jgi:hypothetical protein